MAHTLLASTSAGAASGGAAVTTSGIDTTGATLITLAVTWYSGATAPTITDSKGNTWTALTAQIGGGGDSVGVRWYYVVNPIVGSGHTFTDTINDYGILCVLAWSGNHATPFDVENGSAPVGNGTSIQPGGVTPSAANTLVLTAAALRGNAGSGQTMSVDSGQTKQLQQANGDAMQLAVGYEIQTTATARNPIWSWTTGDLRVASSAVFLAAAVATGGRNLGLMGVG